MEATIWAWSNRHVEKFLVYGIHITRTGDIKEIIGAQARRDKLASRRKRWNPFEDHGTLEDCEELNASTFFRNVVLYTSPRYFPPPVNRCHPQAPLVIPIRFESLLTMLFLCDMLPEEAVTFLCIHQAVSGTVSKWMSNKHLMSSVSIWDLLHHVASHLFRKCDWEKGRHIL